MFDLKKGNNLPWEYARSYFELQRKLQRKEIISLVNARESHSNLERRSNSPHNSQKAVSLGNETSFQHSGHEANAHIPTRFEVKLLQEAQRRRYLEARSYTEAGCQFLGEPIPARKRG